MKYVTELVTFVAALAMSVVADNKDCVHFDSNMGATFDLSDLSR
jgi:hypothetical protein